MEATRKLASIMFTDIVGYSTLMQIDERRATEIRTRHKQIFQEAHKKFGGKIVQYFGDGTLSIFDSNVNAVECAVEMQIEFRKEPEVPLRIGIHSGDITIQGDDAFGTGLNIAARIEPVCEPGGVFISGRVYDDIKNHSWLHAVSLGAFRLKNIFEPVSIYAVTSKGLSVPDEGRMPIRPMNVEPPRRRYDPPVDEEFVGDESPDYGTKNKGVAGLLALFFGVFGVHRFYLGKRRQGVLYFVGFFVLLGLTISLYSDGHYDGPPPIMFLGLLAFIDSILLFAMPKREFDRKYNQVPAGVRRKQPIRKKSTARQPRRQTATQGNFAPPEMMPKSDRSSSLLKSAFRKYKKGDYTGAMKDFEDSLEKDYDNPSVHFMLACCHSIMKASDKSFFHLSSAVDYGFQQFEEIYENEALGYLRSLPEFDIFVQNDYKMVAKLPKPEEGLLESKPYYDTSVLDKISDLGELMERGVISRQEFDQQKEKILNRNEL
jgi:class 3 adenylate cyclase